MVACPNAPPAGCGSRGASLTGRAELCRALARFTREDPVRVEALAVSRVPPPGSTEASLLSIGRPRRSRLATARCARVSSPASLLPLAASRGLPRCARSASLSPAIADFRERADRRSAIYGRASLFRDDERRLAEPSFDPRSRVVAPCVAFPARCFTRPPSMRSLGLAPRAVGLVRGPVRRRLTGPLSRDATRHRSEAKALFTESEYTDTPGRRSSVGRAPGCYPGCPRFETWRRRFSRDRASSDGCERPAREATVGVSGRRDAARDPRAKRAGRQRRAVEPRARETRPTGAPRTEHRE